MAVEINLELDAKGIVQEIAKIEAALEALDGRSKDIDLGESIDSSSLTGDIGKVIDEINNLEANFDQLSRKISGIEDVDMDSEHEVVHKYENADGSTNDGESSGNDPPSDAGRGGGGSDGGGSVTERGLRTNRNRGNSLAELISSVYGVDVSRVAGVDRDSLNQMNRGVYQSSLGITGSARGLKQNFEPDHYSGFEDGELEEMEWNRLQNLASRENVYTENADRETLERRLKSQRFAGPMTSVSDGSRIDGVPESADDILGSTGFQPSGKSGFLGENSEYSLGSGARYMLETRAKARRQLVNSIASTDNSDIFNGLDSDVLSGSEIQDVLSRPSASDPGENEIGDYTQSEKRQYLDALTAQRRAEGDTDVPFDTDLRDVGVATDDKSILGMRSRKDILDNIREGQDKMGNTLRRLVPSMSKYMRLLAAILPIAVALGTQLLGVAAAMGAVGVAGAAMMGLGLIGHGDSMADSFAQAKYEMRDLKEEMFYEVQPLAQQFAPIQSRAFDAIPSGMSGIFEEMEGLDQFENTIFDAGAGLAGGVEEFFAIINGNAGAIDQLVTRFGRILGSGLLDFFEWLIQAAYQNQQLLTSLGGDMMKLVVVAYNLSMAVAKIVTALTLFINGLAFISNLLNSEVIVGLVTMIAYIWALAKTITIMAAMKAAFMSIAGGIEIAALMMGGFTLSTWQAVAAATALVGVLAGLTMGASLLVGGAVMGGMDTDIGGGGGPGEDHNPGSMGAAGTYNDNRQYHFNTEGSDYAQQKDVEGTVEEVNETNSATEVPTTNYGSN